MCPRAGGWGTIRDIARTTSGPGQCGFSSTVEGNALTRDQQIAELALFVQTVEEVWG